MKKKIDLKDIPKDVAFQGYLWMSNKTSPKVLKDKPHDFSKYADKKNPFVVEALLWDKENKVSYHITHSGRYQVYRYKLKKLPKEAELKKVKYLPHRLDGVNKCKFKQLWVAEKDPLCEDMEVLVMKALVFVGFE